MMGRSLLPLLAMLLAGRTLAVTAVPAVAARELDLRDCLALAGEHNPQVRTASTVFLQAEGEAIKLHAILYPTLDTQAISTPLIFYVQLQETLYSRATLPQLRLSRLTREEAELNYRQALLDAAFQVQQAFTAALGAQQQAELGARLVIERDAALKKGRELFDAGKLQRSDVAPLQVLAGLGRQGLTSAQLSGSQALVLLAQAIGVDLPLETRLRDTLPKAAPAQLDSAALTALALRDRPDLRLLADAHLAARQQIEIDLNNTYPILGVESDATFQPPALTSDNFGNFDLERNYDEPETERIAGDTQLPLSLYFNWQIFDGGRLAGVKAGDEARLVSQQEALDQLRRAVPGEVAAALAAIGHERATLEGLDAQPDPATVEKEVETDYEAGRVRLLDRVNLETDLWHQRQLRVAAQVRLALALAALDHALGRGFATAVGSAPAPGPGLTEK